MDSNKNKIAIIGQEIFAVILRRLENFIDRIISVISQQMLRRGTDIKSTSKTANPESMRLNPKSMSNFAPQKSISGNCVNNIAVPLMILMIRLMQLVTCKIHPGIKNTIKITR